MESSRNSSRIETVQITLVCTDLNDTFSLSSDLYVAMQLYCIKVGSELNNELISKLRSYNFSLIL